MSCSAKSADYKRAYGKLITLDIETTPNLAYTFSTGKTVIPMENVLKESSLLSFSWKIYGEDQTFYEAIPLDQEDKWQDRELAVKLHKLLSKVKGVIGHNCVAADTPVLTLDLKWVPAGSLKPGDQLLAFDEGLKPDTPRTYKTEGRQRLVPTTKRMLRAATVTHLEVKKLPAYRVTLSNGDSVVTTEEHPWLTHTRNGRYETWVRTSKLQPGHHRVYRHMTPWEPSQSREAGYLAGLLDGEGFLSMANPGHPEAMQLGFTQRPTVVWDTYQDYCKALGIPLSLGNRIGRRAGQGVGKGDTQNCNVAGGKMEIIRALGLLQPPRLLQTFKERLARGRTSMLGLQREWASVVSVEYVGEQDIAVLSTDTKTYYAAGYAMHNCAAFDLPFITRRFFHHDLGPVPKVHIVDTLTMARETGRGLSNKLAYLTRNQSVEKSAHAKFPGMKLWMEYLAGNPEAYEEMASYNDLDIRSTEVLFDRLRPYSNVYIPGQREAAEESGKPTCLCGSSDLQARGFYTSRTGRYQRYRCNTCGKWLSSRLSEKGQARVSRNVLRSHNQ